MPERLVWSAGFFFNFFFGNWQERFRKVGQISFSFFSFLIIELLVAAVVIIISTMY